LSPETVDAFLISNLEAVEMENTSKSPSAVRRWAGIL